MVMYLFRKYQLRSRQKRSLLFVIEYFGGKCNSLPRIPSGKQVVLYRQILISQLLLLFICLNVLFTLLRKIFYYACKNFWSSGYRY